MLVVARLRAAPVLVVAWQVVQIDQIVMAEYFCTVTWLQLTAGRAGSSLPPQPTPKPADRMRTGPSFLIRWLIRRAWLIVLLLGREDRRGTDARHIRGRPARPRQNVGARAPGRHRGANSGA